MNSQPPRSQLPTPSLTPPPSQVGATTFSIFQTLPPEIRERIYVLALSLDKDDSSSDRAFVKLHGRRRRNTQRRLNRTAILYVNKTIYNEAVPILYKNNPVEIEDPIVLMRWINQVGASNLRFVKAISLCLPGGYKTTGLPTDNLPVKPKHSGTCWRRLFVLMSLQLPELQLVHIFFGARINDTVPLRDMDRVTCGSDETLFPHLMALNTKELRVDGFFAKGWLVLLEKKFGKGVWSSEGKLPAYLRSLKRFQRTWVDKSIDGYP